MQIDLEARDQTRLERDESITITLLETQRAYFVSGRMSSRDESEAALPEPVRRDVKQLDAPLP